MYFVSGLWSRHHKVSVLYNFARVRTTFYNGSNKKVCFVGTISHRTRATRWWHLQKRILLLFYSSFSTNYLWVGIFTHHFPRNRGHLLAAPRSTSFQIKWKTRIRMYLYIRGWNSRFAIHGTFLLTKTFSFSLK